VVTPGESSLEELLAEAGEGVYVTDVAGLHSGVNPVSGTFSVGATGRLIAGGELAAPADEFTIASDLQSMLTAIVAAGSASRWVPFGGSVSTPALLIGEMAVGGS
jgi:PmbA protein